MEDVRVIKLSQLEIAYAVQDPRIFFQFSENFTKIGPNPELFASCEIEIEPE